LFGETGAFLRSFLFHNFLVHRGLLSGERFAG